MAKMKFVAFHRVNGAAASQPGTFDHACGVRNTLNASAGGERMYGVRPHVTVEDKVAMAVELLQAKFPEMGITHGYIGNCDIINPELYDDRSWRIFTDLPVADHSTTFSIPLSGGGEFDVIHVAMLLERFWEEYQARDPAAENIRRHREYQRNSRD